MVSITSKRSSKLLNQIYSNNLNVMTSLIPLPADLSSAATLYTIIFPYKIRVVGLSITSVAVPTGVQPIVITLTDGTSAISVTLAAATTEKQEAEDQVYEADTVLSINNAAGAGNSSEESVLGISYVIESPQRR